MPPTDETPPPPLPEPSGGTGDNAGEPAQQPHASDQGGPGPGAHEDRAGARADNRDPPTAKGQKPRPRKNPGGGVNYETRYAPDAYGEELNPDARVWNVYNDEAKLADTREMNGLKDIIDNLLIFAGLFSAVVTTFVAQSSAKLEPDYAQITASLTYELVLRQRASSEGTPMDEIPASQLSFDSETYKSTDLWVNGLWLTSLTMSLLVALTSVLARQWIQSFESAFEVMSGYSLDVAITREYRRQGFRQWRVKLIIRFLPVLLSVALLLFLTGLAVFTMPMNSKLSSIVITLTSIGTLLYTISTILPVFVPQCAYKTPIYDSLVDFLDFAHAWFRIGCRCKLERGDAIINPDLNFLRTRELLEAANQVYLLSEKALIWLCGYTENNSAVTISAQAIYASLTQILRRTDNDVRRDPDVQAYDMRWAELFLLPCLQAHPRCQHDLRFAVTDILDSAAFPSFAVHDVIRFTVHMRERSRKTARDFAPQWEGVLASVHGILDHLYELLLHPLVWRDLELALLYCISLKEIRSGRVLRLPGEDLSNDEEAVLSSDNYQELTVNVLGDPLVQRPMLFPGYVAARGWKDDKRMKDQLETLRKIIPRVLQYSENPFQTMADFDNPFHVRSARPSDSKRIFTVWRAQQDYHKFFDIGPMGDSDESREDYGDLRQAAEPHSCFPLLGTVSRSLRGMLHSLARLCRSEHHGDVYHELEMHNGGGGGQSARSLAPDATYDNASQAPLTATGDVAAALNETRPATPQSNFSLGGYNHD